MRSSLTRSLAVSFAIGAALTVAGACFSQTARPKFDQVRAFGLLRKQCEFGPRPVGSVAHSRTKDYLVAELRKYSTSVDVQTFPHTTTKGKALQLANVIARFGDQGRQGILLAAHWDTRPTADMEPNVADRARSIIGANDGASGVAVLLDLARMFHDSAPAVPVTIVLLDGEDYGPGGEDMFIGARHFAQGLDGNSGYRFGILLDMIGDKDLQIYREMSSQGAAKSVNQKVWDAAGRLGYALEFRDRLKYNISDDHIPLIRAGVPCIDVIDFDYPYWHTLQDTVDKCSPESLKAVGETIAEVVYSERP